MPDDLEKWMEKILVGDRRAISSAITAVENQEEDGIVLLKRLFVRVSGALVIGVTGAPGSGKSTLVEKLAAEYRRLGHRVGILAVDPTSPFSGGAILGDRIRMQSLSGDEGVFIRSMATRGQLGGLAPAAHDVVTVLEAAGCQVVLIETVGVGQDEVEVARLADITILLLVPGMGDDVQTFKAGVMEIADVFVINKADRVGADRVEQEVAVMLSISPPPGLWRPPILKTVATDGTGVPEVVRALDQFRTFGREQGLAMRRSREKWRARILDLLRQELFSKVASRHLADGILDADVEEIIARRLDPHSVVEDLIADFARR
ncbi:MAG: methylmalonyl Co-A mutase-associated GTPase MeaB [Terriglobia bacterium]